MNGCFLVGHSEDHVVSAPVLKAKQFAANALKSAGFLPQIRGHSDGEHDLLTAETIHFIAKYCLDLLRNALGRGEERIDSVAHSFYVAAAQHQNLAGYLTVSRRLLEAQT